MCRQAHVDRLRIFETAQRRSGNGRIPMLFCPYARYGRRDIEKNSHDVSRAGRVEDVTAAPHFGGEAERSFRRPQAHPRDDAALGGTDH